MFLNDKPLRALVTINDDHGFIRPNQLFLPGWRHENVRGNLTPIREFSEVPEKWRQFFLDKKWAAEVYR